MASLQLAGPARPTGPRRTPFTPSPPLLSASPPEFGSQGDGASTAAARGQDTPRFLSSAKPAGKTVVKGLWRQGLPTQTQSLSSSRFRLATDCFPLPESQHVLIECLPYTRQKK
ncbi:hypothetical protein AAY473_030947 [Plecturocebus cupreus]